VASFLSSVPELMDAGLRGSRLPRGRALALRLGAIAAFLAFWSLLSGAVMMLTLFTSIFLAGPWLLLGNVLDMAIRGQLWIHLAATLERVALGFGAGAVLGVGLGLAAGHLTPIRHIVEPLVESMVVPSGLTNLTVAHGVEPCSSLPV